MGSMNCRKFKEELLLSFGGDNLPEELQRHIEECDECRREYEELRAISASLGDDLDFYPDDITAELLTRQVTKKLVTPLKVSGQRFSWYSVVGVAASVVLVVGIAYFGNFFNSLPIYEGNPRLNSLEMELLNTGRSDMTAAVDESYYEISDEEFNILINDFTAGRTYEAAGQLLNDLSEDEYRYLEENFNVGDML
ncbi:MAG: anti-sigma factor family protein [Candidatus Zixiibacteriota bacterium]